MGWNDFGRSLWFAAGAGFLTIPVFSFWARMGVVLPAAQVVLILALGVYVAGLAPTRQQALRTGGLMLALALMVFGVTQTLAETAVGLVAVLAVCRSGFLVREGSSGQRFAIEGVLGIVGLTAAHLVYDATLYSFAAAIWTFFLAQSAYPLFSAVTLEDDPEDGLTPAPVDGPAADGVCHE